MGLSAGVWLELVLILAAIPLVIFGGAWILRSLVERDRSTGAPKITTLIVEVEGNKGGPFSAHYVAGDVVGHPRPPGDPRPTPTLADLRAVVDEALHEWYRAKRVREAIVVDYSIFPWGEGQIPEDLTEQIGTDWLVFDVEEQGGFTATNRNTGLTATADSLDALPLAVEVAIAARWHSLAPDVPGMLTWQRTLTYQGFASCATPSSF